MAEHDDGPVREGAPSQTLSRALTLLETVVEAPEPPTIADLADGLGVHRSVAYRMLRTFEAHGLLRRDGLGRVHAAPGPGGRSHATRGSRDPVSPGSTPPPAWPSSPAGWSRICARRPCRT